jgi:hypothetical protein
MIVKMENNTILQQVEPQDIAEVARTWDTGHVNRYLASGWVIMALVKQQTGPESYSLDYHLGWPRQLGMPIQPDLITHYTGHFSSKDKASADAVDGVDVPF